jgi:Cd2+/Zn2+-exporting ATPase
MPGVEDVIVSVTAGTMTVRHGETTNLAAIEKKVMGLGYSVAPLAGKAAPTPSEHQHDHDHHHDHDSHDHFSRDHADHDHHDNAAKEIEGLHGRDHAPTNGSWWASRKGRLTIMSGAALVAAYAIGHLVPSIAPYAFIVAILVGLVPIARRAVMAAMAGTPFSIEMLMTIAAVGAVIINAGEEAATVVFLFLVGELLEGVAA